MAATARSIQPVLAIIGFLLISALSRVSGLSLTVGTMECVYEYVFYEGDTVSGNFIVDSSRYYWEPKEIGMDFTVTGPGDNIINTLKGSSGDKFEFKAPRSGMYKFCFHNPSSTPESVTFNIHTGHIPTQSDLAKDEHLDPINVKIAQLKESLESVTLEQRYLRARDLRHRHTNENTRKRVIFYTLGEYVLLAVLSGLQVFYIRRLFSNYMGAYSRV